MIELHTHLLHGIDDGPESVTEAVELARALISDSARIVVVTPHVSKAYPGTLALLDERLAELRGHLDRAEITLDVRPGAEIDLHEAEGLDHGQLRRLTISGGSWILLESPHTAYPFGMLELVAELRVAGLQVVLAHPERSPHLQDDIHLVEKAVAAGALVQLTGASLRGRLGRRSEASAWELLDAGLAHIVSSDAHDTSRRPPDMTTARDLIATRYGTPLATTLTETAPAAVLDSADHADVVALVEVTRPAPAPRRGGLLRRRRRAVP